MRKTMSYMKFTFQFGWGSLKGASAPCENLNISNFNANKNITTKHIIKSFSKNLPSYNNI